MKCPLCGGVNNSLFSSDKRRDYYRCVDCALVFVPESQRLSSEDEKKEYDKHENDPSDIGYRKFLGRLFNPLCEKLDSNSFGLDFGSGPGPTLSVMLQEVGHIMNVFDIFYANKPEVLNKTYNFITCTEVIEHLHQPDEILNSLVKILDVEGLLCFMTKMVIDQQSFAKWHYKNDMTHVCFYSKETFQWIAERYNCSVEFIDKDVIFLKKIN